MYWKHLNNFWLLKSQAADSVLGVHWHLSHITWKLCIHSYEHQPCALALIGRSVCFWWERGVSGLGSSRNISNLSFFQENLQLNMLQKFAESTPKKSLLCIFSSRVFQGDRAVDHPQTWWWGCWVGQCSAAEDLAEEGWVGPWEVRDVLQPLPLNYCICICIDTCFLLFFWMRVLEMCVHHSSGETSWHIDKMLPWLPDLSFEDLDHSESCFQLGCMVRTRNIHVTQCLREELLQYLCIDNC